MDRARAAAFTDDSEHGGVPAQTTPQPLKGSLRRASRVLRRSFAARPCHRLVVGPGCKEYASAEQVEVGAAAALPFDQLDPGHLAFDLAGVPGGRQTGDDRVPIVEESVGELSQGRQVVLSDQFDPFVEVFTAVVVRERAGGSDVALNRSKLSRTTVLRDQRRPAPDHGAVERLAVGADPVPTERSGLVCSCSAPSSPDNLTVREEGQPPSCSHSLCAARRCRRPDRLRRRTAPRHGQVVEHVTVPKGAAGANEDELIITDALVSPFRGEAVLSHGLRLVLVEGHLSSPWPWNYMDRHPREYLPHDFPQYKTVYDYYAKPPLPRRRQRQPRIVRGYSVAPRSATSWTRTPWVSNQ